MRIYWLRHLGSIALLVSLDINHRLRQRLNRGFLRVTIGLLGILLAAIALSSLTALLNITNSVRALIGDALVGVEASVSMRSAMRETRLDLLHLRLDSNLQISAAEVDRLQVNFTDLLSKYRTGAFEKEDMQTAAAIEQALRAYLTRLRPLVANLQPSIREIETADTAGAQVLELVEQAYEYNRARLHDSAQAASISAQNALSLSTRLWWGFAVVMSSILLLYLAYRWLALPDQE
jgi:hypothetical protein